MILLTRLIRFLEREKKEWITEVKGSWMKLRDYVASLKLRDMTAYSIDDSTLFMKSIKTRMKNAEKVQIKVSIGKSFEKFFVINRIE